MPTNGFTNSKSAPAAPDSKKKLILGSVAGLTILIAGFLLLRGGGDDGPTVDPKLAEKASQIEANLRAVSRLKFVSVFRPAPELFLIRPKSIDRRNPRNRVAFRRSENEPSISITPPHRLHAH